MDFELRYGFLPKAKGGSSFAPKDFRPHISDKIAIFFKAESHSPQCESKNCERETFSAVDRETVRSPSSPIVSKGY